MSWANSAITSGRMIVAAIGMPLPMGLPIVTMSGTNGSAAVPWREKPHIASPRRPKPGCTSSAR